MAKKQTRKPAKRKSTRSGSRGVSPRLKGAGWLVATAVAGTWAVSAFAPGVVTLSSWRFAHLRDLVNSAGSGKEIGEVIADFERTKPPEEHEQVATTGSIPKPRKRLQETPAAHPTRLSVLEGPAAIPMPRSAPPMPVAEPTVQERRPEPGPLPPVAIARSPSIGMGTLSAPQGKRHATRNLAVHSAPDGGSSKVAEIESGTSLVVIRSAGDWRLVRDVRTSSEGWVDGRYLAGEAMAADLASFGPSR